MGSRGPLPQRKEVLEMRKSWRASQAVEQAKPSGERVLRPRWLNESAKRIWRTLAPKMIELGILTPLDALAFGRYCTMCARYISMKDDAAAMTDPSYAKLVNQQGDSLLKLEQQFGLTPASRSRLNLPEKQASASNSKAHFFT